MKSPTRFLALAAAMLMVGSVGVTVQAASASAATFRPDGWVRYKSFKDQNATYLEPSAWVGDNVYNLTARNQKSVERVGGSYAPDAHFVFEIRAQNDGAADRFRVSVKGTGDWVAKYFHGTTNITPDVVAGTYRTPIVGSGQSVTLKVKVWIGVPGDEVMRLVTLTSAADDTKQDAVKIRIPYSACTC